MKRKPVVGISMKIYKNYADEMVNYVSALKDKRHSSDKLDLFIFPSMGTLYPVAKVLEGSSIKYGSQNIAPEKNGAYTGEFSIESLLDLKASLVEIGHYERRHYFNETDEMINKKVKLALSNDIEPVICIGEPEGLTIGETRSHLYKQIKSAFSNNKPSDLSNIILAYEPFWAIGKKESATSDHIHRTHAMIRDIIAELYSEDLANEIRIIYGGSVSKDNARNILNNDSVDGVFVGRFGHNINQFMDIVNIVMKIKNKNEK